MAEEKYTLEEAYAEILRIKKESGMLDYQNKAEQVAFANGYAKACKDLPKNPPVGTLAIDTSVTEPVGYTSKVKPYLAVIKLLKIIK